jgi:hypothetical protein
MKYQEKDERKMERDRSDFTLYYRLVFNKGTTSNSGSLLLFPGLFKSANDQRIYDLD